MINERPIRCPWCGDAPLYVKYHDEEWGRPVTDYRPHGCAVYYTIENPAIQRVAGLFIVFHQT